MAVRVGHAAALLAAALVAGVALSGCARPPAALRGAFPPTTVADAQAGGLVGERVRWGGEIVRTTPGADDTCFEVVSQPLDRRAEPRAVDQSFGRFLACAPGFYDPAIYAEKRELTVVGTVEGFTAGQVGERPYSFPQVRADTVYLWPKRQPRPMVVYDPWPYWGPSWGPYPYWGPWGWYGGGWLVGPGRRFHR